MLRNISERQHRRRRRVALASAMLLAVFLSPAHATAAVVTSATITLFNSDPHTVTGAPVGGVLPSGTPDYTPSNAMVSLVNNTPAGASIHVAEFYIDPAGDGGIIAALNSAASRGVNVSVVLDNGGGGGQPAKNALSASVHVTLCAHACINTTGDTVSGVGTPGIAHSKLILFSSTVDQNGTARTNVVADGSQNFNYQQFLIHNNWVVSYDDPPLYTGFMNFWSALDSQTATPTNPAVSATISSATNKIKAYFYPRPATDDPVANLVNQLDCSKGGTIYAQSSTWTSDRTLLNNALIAQSNAGCTVQLLMDDFDGPENVHYVNYNDGTAAHENYYGTTDTNRNMNSNVFGTNGITVYGVTPGGCRYTTQGGSQNHYCNFADGGSHEKYLAVVGKTSSGATVKSVISGSENFAKRALTSYTEVDEEISDATITQGFIDDFNRQKAETISINPEKYPTATYTTVNSNGSGSQDMPGIAKVANYTAVAWADNGNPTAASTGKYGAIYLKLMRSDGSTVYEVPVQAQTVANSGSDYRVPSVGIDNNGNAVVAWQDDDDGNGSYNVVMRSVTNTGTATPTIGSRIYVNAAGAGEQISPSLAMTSDGHFSVSFLDDQTGSGNYQVRLSTYTSAASKVTEILVNGTTTGTHTQANVAVYPTTGGSWATVVVWNDDSDGNGYGDINGRAVTQTGVSVWAEKRLNATVTGDQTVPKVSANASGFVVTWELWKGSDTSPCTTYAVLPGNSVAAADTNRCIQVREFDASATAAHNEFVVSNGLFTTGGYEGSNCYTNLYPSDPDVKCPNPNIGDQRSPGVAIDSSGDYVVSWQELTPYHPGYDVFARGFLKGGGSNAGTLSEYQMNPVISNNQLSPAIASDSSGNFSLVYTDDADGNGSTQLVERNGFRIT